MPTVNPGYYVLTEKGKRAWEEGWETGQHYLALQFGCECELRPDCSKAVPVVFV